MKDELKLDLDFELGEELGEEEKENIEGGHFISGSEGPNTCPW